MKRIMMISVSVIVVAALVIGATMVMAAKPQDVIERSNGFPSGLHFNLNIHGKDPSVFICTAGPGGNSVFVPIDGTATIQYVANKKRTNPFPDGASAYELNVLDPCAVTGDTTAKVYLPTKVEVVDDYGNVTHPNAEGYYVFARILGKPNDGDGGGPSTMILEPNIVLQACNDPGTDPDFPDYTDCLLALGLIIGGDLYVPDDETFVRFESQDPPKKGKSKARDITPLFTYTGWVYWGESPDTNEDGNLTVDDIPGDWATSYPGADLNSDATLELCEWVLYHPDINGDGTVDAADATLAQDYEPCSGTPVGDGVDPITLEEWQAFQESLGHAEYFEDEWIFNIADLVVTAQGIYNDGARLVQIRFYPANPDLTHYNPE